jgi:hypothetical protein
MGLQNLVGISLEQITPARETVKRLLEPPRVISPTPRLMPSALRRDSRVPTLRSVCWPMWVCMLTVTER